MQIVVVKDKYTDKIYPFSYSDIGEIILTSSGIANIQNLIVTKVDTRLIDLENMLILQEEDVEEASNLY